MERTLSFKTATDTADWVDSHPGGRSAFLRELVERARQAEVDARDLAIIAAHGGDIADVDAEHRRLLAHGVGLRRCQSPACWRCWRVESSLGRSTTAPPCRRATVRMCSGV